MRGSCMSGRQEIVSEFYERFDEENRLGNSRCGQLEYLTSMHYIHKYVTSESKIIEIGAGTGRYSIALSKEGYDVTAVELVQNNLDVLRKNSQSIDNIRSYLGDATNLDMAEDDAYDITLALGPFYHLYDKNEVNKAIDEAIRVTRKNGIIMGVFLSVYAILYSEYLNEGLKAGLEENFTMSDEDFNRFAKYHLATCETRENLGTSNHLIYFCRKK